MAVTVFVKVALLLTLIIVAAISGYFILYELGISQTKSSSTTSSVDAQTFISQIAYIHWKYVSLKNVTALFSQYSTEYQAVWFFFNGTSSLSTLNGRHDCNPAGGIDCSYNVKSAWNAFFNDTPPLNSYSVCGYNFSLQYGARALVSATVWFESSGQSNQSSVATLEVPYQIVFESINGTWQLWKEFFGLPNEPTTIFTTRVLPPLSCSQ